MFNIYKLLVIFFIFFVCSSSFAQNLNEKKHYIENQNVDNERLESLYIGNFLSSIVANKNRDYKSFLDFSERALKSNNNMGLLENAFWANIYLGNISRALKIVSEIELLSDENNQDFLYPTIVELIKRNELTSAVEISNLLGLERHNVFLKNMLEIWDKVFKNQKANALSKLQNYIISAKKDSDLYFFLKVQHLMIYAYFDEHSETIKAFEELQQNIKIVPSRYYISIAKIIYDKIDTKFAKSFLSQNIPNNLDLEIALKNLSKIEIFDLSKMLSNVFYECGYIVARSEGFFESVPQFWFSLHLNENNEESRLILSSFFSEVNQDDIALDILRDNKIKSPSWIISEFEKSYILEKKGNIELAISTIRKFSNKNNFKNKALLRISNFS